MIITKTPFRISFVGGGSDLPSFYRQYGGKVLSTTIDKYMYISLHPTFQQEKTIIKYSKTEIVDDINNIQHPIARQLLQNYHTQGVEIVSTADVIAGTGLSTSSAYTVGLIHALSIYNNKFKYKQEIAAEACIVELDQLHEPIGKQDQYGTAIGGLKIIEFLPDNSVVAHRVVLSPKSYRKLNQNLLLFYTGVTHSSSEILKEQNNNLLSDQKKNDALRRMVELVDTMYTSLITDKIDDIGLILHTNWLLKKSLASSISNPVIDNYYNLALQNGALGGKLLGAGGGGFLLFYCPLEHQDQLRWALSDLRELPFEMENLGTQLIYNEG